LEAGFSVTNYPSKGFFQIPFSNPKQGALAFAQMLQPISNTTYKNNPLGNGVNHLKIKNNNKILAKKLANFIFLVSCKRFSRME